MGRSRTGEGYGTHQGEKPTRASFVPYPDATHGARFLLNARADPSDHSEDRGADVVVVASPQGPEASSPVEPSADGLEPQDGTGA